MSRDIDTVAILVSPENEGADGTHSPVVPSSQMPGTPRPLAPLIRWESGLVIALVGVFIFGWLGTSGNFLHVTNVLYMGQSYGDYAVMALPLMLIVVAGEIDLSVAAILAMSSSLLGYLWLHHWPMIGILVTVLCVGAVAGAVNGLLVTRLSLPSLAVTIGTLTLYGGVAYIILGDNTVSSFPAPYTDIGTDAFPHTFLSWSTVVFIVLAIAFGVVLHATRVGRSIFAMGANKEAAIYAGVRVKRIKTVLYIVSGVVSSLVGIMYTFRLNTAEPDAASGYLLLVVVIVLFAGVSIFGGTGTIVGVVLSALFWAVGLNALSLTSFNEGGQGIVIGVPLILSVTFRNGPAVVDRARDALGLRRDGGAPWRREFRERLSVSEKRRNGRAGSGFQLE